MNRTVKYCQSCGRILKKDNIGYEVNGEESIYCSWCYCKGKFTQNITLNEMQEMVKVSLKDKPIPNFIKQRIVERISNLQRWQEGRSE